jgi:hypothetical protein
MQKSWMRFNEAVIRQYRDAGKKSGIRLGRRFYASKAARKIMSDQEIANAFLTHCTGIGTKEDDFGDKVTKLKSIGGVELTILRA